jgi:hypothetical protein
MLDEEYIPKGVNIGPGEVKSGPGVYISAFYESNPAWARDPSLAQPDHNIPAQPDQINGAWRGNPGQAGFS